MEHGIPARPPTRKKNSSQRGPVVSFHKAGGLSSIPLDGDWKSDMFKRFIPCKTILAESNRSSIISRSWIAAGEKHVGRGYARPAASCFSADEQGGRYKYLNRGINVHRREYEFQISISIFFFRLLPPLLTIGISLIFPCFLWLFFVCLRMSVQSGVRGWGWKRTGKDSCYDLSVTIQRC